MLDDLLGHMDSVKVNELLSRLEHCSADTALAAEAELAMLWAVSRVAHLEVEPALVGTRRLRAMGIRDRPTAPRSPWQNRHAERLIGSIRRACLDHMIVLGESHLRRILKSYASYYNELRTHLSLGKDAPLRRPVQQFGAIAARPVLGGLHDHYCRI